jgi:hypothetical protein
MSPQILVTPSRPSEIRIPDYRYSGTSWRITHPKLKLALKYGVVGPWKAPNWSVAFDAHALSRGPNKGTPTLADFCVTSLMGSRPRTADLTRLTTWLVVKKNAREVSRLTDVLQACRSLCDAPPEAVRQIAILADRMIQDKKALRGIGLAKVYKWLAAWAPAHVPMFDSLVHHALTGYWPTYWRARSDVLLERFRSLLLEHIDVLNDLGRWLFSALDGSIPAAITPIRVLDSLIWFDWGPYPGRDFKAFFRPYKKGDCLQVRDKIVARFEESHST